MVGAEGMDIQSIVPSVNEGDEFYSGCVQIQRVTSGMATECTYTYLTAADAYEVDKVAEPGWFDEDWTERIEYTFDAGEGFVGLSDYDEAFIRIPGIKLN